MMRGRLLTAQIERSDPLCAGWVNYMLLPEAINREWNGQGVIGWAKTRVYEPLKRRCDGKRKTAVSINIVRLQVPKPQGP